MYRISFSYLLLTVEPRRVIDPLRGFAVDAVVEEASPEEEANAVAREGFSQG